MSAFNRYLAIECVSNTES